MFEPEYRIIPLTQGMETIVSSEDYERLLGFKWYAKMDRPSVFYAYTRSTGFWQGMHREILGLKFRDGLIADHINHDTLDNRRSNLRIANATESTHNTKTPITNTSGFKGVHFSKRDKVFIASIWDNKKRLILGSFRSPEEASAVYQKAALRLRGEFARF